LRRLVSQQPKSLANSNANAIVLLLPGVGQARLAHYEDEGGAFVDLKRSKAQGCPESDKLWINNSDFTMHTGQKSITRLDPDVGGRLWRSVDLYGG
jgi:hypothetical protein